MPSLSGLTYAPCGGRDRLAVDALEITSDGIAQDRHAGPGNRQVSLLDAEASRVYLECLKPGGKSGLGKENLLIEGLPPLRPVDRLQVGAVMLEITQVGPFWTAEAAPACPPEKECLMSEYGAFARVLAPGVVKRSDAVLHLPRTLRAEVITLSDRAHSGIYEDKSGPRLLELLQAFATHNNWRLDARSTVIPDEPTAFDEVIDAALKRGADLILSTGSTGPGRRDIAPEVVLARSPKVIPGIMEHIRLKYGQDKPHALLSRGVAAVIGDATLICTLPGSPRAVGEYFGEIEKLLPHLLLLLHGIDPH